MKMTIIPENLNGSVAATYQYKSPLPFRFEENFDYRKHRQWMEDHPLFFTSVIAFYLAFIYFGRKFMENRKRLELRNALIVWNGSLALFSIMGSIRVVPEMIYVLKDMGFQHSICESTYATHNSVTSLWTWLFVTSKIPELGDTIFLVLRKQKLIFLHWYHHAIVAFYCWFTYLQLTSMARWFVTMNFIVHACMYTYFFLRALHIKVPSILAMSITITQLLQMAIGTTVCFYAKQYIAEGIPCNTSAESAYFALLMYFSFFVLFSNFFVHTYFMGGKKQVTVKQKDS